jgi:hypothetical protein
MLSCFEFGRLQPAVEKVGGHCVDVTHFVQLCYATTDVHLCLRVWSWTWMADIYIYIVCEHMGNSVKECFSSL